MEKESIKTRGIILQCKKHCWKKKQTVQNATSIHGVRNLQSKETEAQRRPYGVSQFININRRVQPRGHCAHFMHNFCHPTSEDLSFIDTEL